MRSLLPADPAIETAPEKTDGLGLEFHHLGLAVRHPERAARFLALLGYALEDPTYDPLQKRYLAMARHPTGQPALEVTYSGPEPGPIDGLLEGREERVSLQRHLLRGGE